MLSSTDYEIYEQCMRLETDALTASDETEQFQLRYKAREQWLVFKNILEEALVDAPNERALNAALCYAW